MTNEFILFKQRSGEWCAAPPGFRNIVRYPIGRGDTQDEAVRDLLVHPEFVHRGLAGEWPLYASAADFVEVAFERAFFRIEAPARAPARTLVFRAAIATAMSAPL